MTRAEIARIVTKSRSYGWFRPNLDLPEGYRPCPLCRTRIAGRPTAPARDDALARLIQDAIDDAMAEHLTECVAAA